MTTKNSRLEQFAHLLRRAGFGATRAELEEYSSHGYEAFVEGLLSPSDRNRLPDDLIRRYNVDQSELRLVDSAAANWLYRMITTDAPLEEKIALFWHSLLATGERKVNNPKSLHSQIEMFRRHGLGKLPKLLVEMSKDPAMIHWLDNNDNHRDAVNENFGRELLELFSMGIGNYTEEDVRECSRAFTGWTMENAEYMALKAHKASIWPYSRVAWQFEYRAHDHDDGEKTFLGETGNFNGEEIIDIIVKQPATAQFICRRLYQFFVADEIADEGEALIEQLGRTYFDSGYEIRSVLRTLFTSEHFKSDSVRFARVKSPVELVVGTLRTAEAFQWPSIDVHQVALSTNFMGQELLNPPTVEGWHEGTEWIDGGTLIERVNFAASYLGAPQSVGVRRVMQRLADLAGGDLSPSEVVDICLDQMGPLPISEDTRKILEGHLTREDETTEASGRQIAEVFRLIVSSSEYQMA